MSQTAESIPKNQRFTAAPFSQPDLTVYVEVEQAGKTWRVRWREAGMDADVSAHDEFHRRTMASTMPDVFSVFEAHKPTLPNKAEISGNRTGGSALHLSQEAALEIAGAARATFADALVRPLRRFSFERDNWTGPVADEAPVSG